MAYREYRKARPTPYGKLTDPQAEPLMNALRSRGLKDVYKRQLIADALARSNVPLNVNQFPDLIRLLLAAGLDRCV